MATQEKESRAQARNGEGENQTNESGALIPSALLIGGAALLQPELIPGIAIGAAALLLPKYIPDLGGVFRPLAKSMISLGYSAALKTMTFVAEASEEVQDMIAEARVEQDANRNSRQDRPSRRG
jgi:hypothetical protein